MNGVQLKESRLQSGLTQKQLASLIGKTESFICLLEKDRRLPNKTITRKLEFIFRDKGININQSFEERVIEKLDEIIKLLNSQHKV